jgi:DNA-binding XRE family transcriptional regulator
MIFAHSLRERSAKAVRLQLPRRKIPNPIDKHVGSRVRMRRKMLAMSQEQLADALGLSFQQVRKNENGTNRIGASRLQAGCAVRTITAPRVFCLMEFPPRPPVRVPGTPPRLGLGRGSRFGK